MHTRFSGKLVLNPSSLARLDLVFLTFCFKNKRFTCTAAVMIQSTQIYILILYVVAQNMLSMPRTTTRLGQQINGLVSRYFLALQVLVRIRAWLAHEDHAERGGRAEAGRGRAEGLQIKCCLWAGRPLRPPAWAEGRVRAHGELLSLDGRL